VSLSGTLGMAGSVVVEVVVLVPAPLDGGADPA
jgi:hypothetical protein